MTVPGMSSDLDAALKASNLRELGLQTRDRLLSGAEFRHFDSGAWVQHQGETRHHVHLVVSGLVRMVVGTPEGRSIAVRYCRAGSLIGIASLFAPGFVLPVSIVAMTPVDLLDLQPDTVIELAARDSAVSRALLTETSERVQCFVEEIPLASFATVPQRVARHLLDSATAEDGGSFVVQLNQEDLAAAVGTVREVAARALRRLRDRGLIRTERGRITLVDLDGLLQATADSE